MFPLPIKKTTSKKRKKTIAPKDVWNDKRFKQVVDSLTTPLLRTNFINTLNSFTSNIYWKLWQLPSRQVSSYRWMQHVFANNEFQKIDFWKNNPDILSYFSALDEQRVQLLQKKRQQTKLVQQQKNDLLKRQDEYSDFINQLLHTN